MLFAIHPGDELPIYRQVVRQITEALILGSLAPGEKLPSHRELAERLVIAPLTVKNAYDELERLGFIETHRGRGTFACHRLPKFKFAEQRGEIESTGRKLLLLSRMVGLNFDETVALLRKTDKELAMNAEADLSASARRNRD